MESGEWRPTSRLPNRRNIPQGLTRALPILVDTVTFPCSLPQLNLLNHAKTQNEPLATPRLGSPICLDCERMQDLARRQIVDLANPKDWSGCFHGRERDGRCPRIDDQGGEGTILIDGNGRHFSLWKSEDGDHRSLQRSLCRRAPDG